MAESSARELIQARRGVEAELAALVAEHGSLAEIAALGQQLAARRAHWADPEGYSRSDLAFHLAIARGAHNSVLYHLRYCVFSVRSTANRSLLASRCCTPVGR